MSCSIFRTVVKQCYMCDSYLSHTSSIVYCLHIVFLILSKYLRKSSMAFALLDDYLSLKYTKVSESCQFNARGKVEMIRFTLIYLKSIA